MLNELIRSSDLFAGLRDQSKSFNEDIVPTVPSLHWSELDDRRLLEQVSRLGENRWNLIGKKLARPSVQCKERYFHRLRPCLMGSQIGENTIMIDTPTHRKSPDRPWSEAEDTTVKNLYHIHGPSWKKIAKELALVSDSAGSPYHRSANETQQHVEQLLYRQPLNNSVHDQENHPPVCTNLRNSLVSKSTSIKRRPPTLTEAGESNKTGNNLTMPPNLQLLDGEATLQTRVTICKPEPCENSPSTVSYTSMPLLNQLSLRQTSNPDRLTINLPCVSKSSNSTLTSLPLFRRSGLSSINRKHRPTYKLKFTTPWSQRLVPRSPHSPLIKDSPAEHSLESSSSKTKTSSFLNTTGSATSVATGIIVDDLFLVQTPTKALSEADHRSFHLSSPPAVLRNLVTGNGNARYVGRTQKLEVDQAPVRSRGPYLSSKLSERRPVCARLFDGPTSNPSTRDDSFNLISPFNAPLPSTSRSLISTKSSVSVRSTSDDAKCLAVLTAKATVWSKALNPTATTVPNMSAPKTHQLIPFDNHPACSSDTVFSLAGINGASGFGGAHYTLREPLLPTVRLRIPPRQQPQLVTRRVVQVGFEEKWRRFALGVSKTHRLTTRMARQFLTDYGTFDSLNNARKEVMEAPPSQPSRLDSLLTVKTEVIEFDPLLTRSPVKLCRS